MMQPSAQDGSTRRRERIVFAVLLAAIAGFVDAAGYLLLFHLFTAHMSGNSAAMGAHLGQGQWAEALHRAFPIPCFVVGVACGAAITELAMLRHCRAPFALVLAAEAVLLGAFLLLGGGLAHADAMRAHATWQLYALAALPALAMGMQNATLRRVGQLHIRTTYVSGMLTNFAEAGVDFLFQTMPREVARGHMALYGGLWCAFASGALGGGYAEALWGRGALVVPLCALALVIAQDWRTPITIRSPHHAGTDKKTLSGNARF